MLNFKLNEFLRYAEQGLFSLYNFLLIWIAFKTLETSEAANLGVIIAIYTFAYTLVNSYISTPLLFIRDKDSIPEIYPIQFLFVIIATAIIFYEKQDLTWLLIPIWCIRDLLRVFSIHLEDQKSVIPNLLAFLILIVVFLAQNFVNEQNALFFVLIASCIPVITSAYSLNRLHFETISLFRFISEYKKYGSVNTFEMIVANVIWQAPVIFLSYFGYIAQSLMFSKIMQIINISGTILRIATLLNAKHVRKKIFISRVKIVLSALCVISVLFSIGILLLFYPDSEGIPRRVYLLSSLMVICGYSFIFISKLDEWRYRTLPQKIRRIYHQILFFSLSVFTAVCVSWFVGLEIAIAVYLVVNYAFQVISFRLLVRG